jgi:signal transduction histidine kinase
MLTDDLSQILGPLARGDNLSDVLDSICDLIETDKAASQARAAVYVFDGGEGLLHFSSGPSLPDEFRQAIVIRKPGDERGSCAAAANRHETVICPDIADDPVWRDLRETAIAASIRACWAHPILGRDDTILGVIALYFPKPRRPSAREIRELAQFSLLAGIAIEHDRHERERANRSALLDSMVENINQGVAVFDADLRLVHFNRIYQDFYEFPPDLLRPGLPYAEVIRHLITRGHYGKVEPESFIARRLADIRQTPEWRNLRYMADGTAVAIFRRNLPGGGMICTFTDVTQEMWSATADHHSAQLLASTLDNVNVGIRVLNREGRLALCNQRYREIFELPEHLGRPGTPYREILNHTAKHHIDKEATREAHIEHRLEELRTPQPSSKITRTVTGKLLHITRAPLPGGGLVTTYVDITDIRNTEDELKAKSALLQMTQDFMGQGICVMDSDLRITNFNQRWADMFKLPPDIARIGGSMKSVLRFRATRGDYGPGKLDDLVNDRVEKFRDGVSYRVERAQPDGLVVAIQRNPAPGGGFITTYTDVSVRWKAEQELARKSRLLETMFETVSQGIAVYDADYRLVSRNRQYADILGFAEGELPAGTSYDDVIRKLATDGSYGDRPVDEVLRDFHTAIETLPESTFEHVCPDGKTLIVHRVRMPEAGFVVTLTDITKMRNAEHEAGEKSRLLELAFANMSQGIAIHDRDLRLIACNDKYASWRGNLPPELTRPGTRHEDIVRYRARRGDYGPGDVEQHVRDRTDKMRRGDINVPTRLVDGRVIRAQRESMPDGGFVTTYTDITDLKKVEGELTRARDVAETANLAKTEFLANMSHELRTPLNAVIGFSEIMRDEMYGALGDRRYREYSANIAESGRHLLSLIDDILDLSKIEAGKMTLTESSVDVCYLIESCVVLLRDQAQSRGIQVEASSEPRLPRLLADNRKLKQVLLNLMQNSVKFTPPGGTVKTSANLTPEGEMRIVIADTGIGMKEEDIPRALDRFGQVEGSLSRSHNGAGLGLPLSKSLVELHGGTFAISSRPQHGTRITICLPRERVLPSEKPTAFSGRKRA